MPVENSKQRSDWFRRKESRERREDGRATYFDGSAYISASVSPAPAATQAMTVSAWVYAHRSDIAMSLLRTTTALQRFQVNFGGGPRLLCSGRNSVGASVLNFVGTAAASGGIGPLFEWHHLLLSWHLDGTPEVNMYVDDVPQTVTTIDAVADETVALNQTTDWAIGAETNGSNPFYGAIFNVWAETDLFVDLDDVNVRRQFITANKLPRYLGRVGDRPFGLGTPPYLFFQGGPNTIRRARGLQATDYNSGGGLILPRSGPPLASRGD